MLNPRELDYYGAHTNSLHSFGGYAPNTKPFVSLPPSQFDTSTTKRDYLPPPTLTGNETSPAQVFLGRSGFSVAKALHNPTSQDVLRAYKDQAAGFYDLGSKLSRDCNIPPHLQTENSERFSSASLSPSPCGLKNNWWMESPGSRETGFTSCYSSVNPVFWRQHDPVMDQLGKNPPDIRTNAASTTQVDYQPHDLVNANTAIPGTIRTRATSGTGFTCSKELHPCFLPEPCVYGKHTTSFLGDPSRFQTTYLNDYRHRLVTYNLNGREVVGSGNPLIGEQSKDFTLGCLTPPTYLTEMRDSYTNHWPLSGQRNFGLSQPIGEISSSGFVHSTKRHAIRQKPCEGDQFDLLNGGLEPQRYNPWPRFYLGHKTMIDKSYRPNPMTTGIDYAITTSLPTTDINPQTYFY